MDRTNNITYAIITLHKLYLSARPLYYINARPLYYINPRSAFDFKDIETFFNLYDKIEFRKKVGFVFLS